MEKYRDLLLLEFLMFSKDIDSEILEFSDSLLEIDNNTIEELIERIKNENVYTEHNIENLKKVVKFLEPKLGEYEDIMYELCSVIPSNDIYYYEFMNKWDVLENEIKNLYSTVSKKFLEESIRFDFYAFSSLTVSSIDYVEKFLPNLIHNSLYILFIRKLLSEYPDALLNKKLRNRIISILELDIKTLEDDETIKYLQKLLKQVNYFGANKKVEIFDYEKFEYHRNKALIEHLITSDVDLDKYHEYLISDYFIEQLRTYIEVYDLPEMKELFLYDEQMKESIKDILSYILKYRQDNNYKIIYNTLLFKLSKLQPAEKLDFYVTEAMNKYTPKEILETAHQKDFLLNDINGSLQADYLILESYNLPEENFNNILDSINLEYYIMWFKKMMKVDCNFFYNDILKRRTIKILEALEQKSNDKNIQKMKKKIIKMNKELEY